MTAPAPSGGSSPLRVGGVALLALGAVAGIIGVATLVAPGGGGGPTAAPSSTSTTVSGTAGPPGSATDGTSAPGTPPGGEPGTSGAVPLPSFDATPTGGPAVPGQAGPDGGNGAGGAGGGGAGAGSGGGGGAAVRAPLRVYNNSTIEGLAAGAAADFEAAGWPVTEVSGHRGLVSTSTAYYREGTSEKAAADQLASEFGLRSAPRFAGIQDASPGVIVIVTRDYGSN